MKFFKLIAAIAAGVFLSLGPVFSNAVSSNAPDRDELYDEIVVSAVGFETPKSHIGSAISVITAEDIELLQADFVTDALSHLSGVSFDQDGGMGGVGYLRMRGFDRALCRRRRGRYCFRGSFRPPRRLGISQFTNIRHRQD